VRTHLRKTVPLGELIAAAFDEAARYSTDPREVARLAIQAVEHLLSILAPKRLVLDCSARPAA
jgi:hypothetical protein